MEYGPTVDPALRAFWSAYDALRAAGVLVERPYSSQAPDVVVMHPADVCSQAEQLGMPIPPADVVLRLMRRSTFRPLLFPLDVRRRRMYVVARAEPAWMHGDLASAPWAER